MKQFWNNIFLARNFFIAVGVIAFVFLIGHFYEMYHNLALVLLLVLLILLVIDTFLLYRTKGISATREVSSILSNGDENECKLILENRYSHKVVCTIYEEIPFQLALRELKFPTSVNAQKSKTITYELVPKERGEYDFGDIVILTRTPFQLISRRFTSPASKKVMVYPSFLKLNQLSFKNFKHYSQYSGAKKTRRIGHSSEFEHIKGYIKGDDIRHINWKASAKRSDLMINQYREERAQQIYSIIDTGRAMEMPFEGLSLLDYAINSTLALSHVIIRNNDRAGVIYFNKQVDKILPANKAISQLPKVRNLLYNIRTAYSESNFEKLYSTVKFKLSNRSLLLLYTNFEDMNAVERQLPYLKGLAKNNVVVVIFFENTTLLNLTTKSVSNTNEFYEKAVAEKMVYQKKLMVKQLNKYGIHTVLTDPKNLTVNTIDKYLEIKSRGIL